MSTAVDGSGSRIDHLHPYLVRGGTPGKWAGAAHVRTADRQRGLRAARQACRCERLLPVMSR